MALGANSSYADLAAFSIEQSLKKTFTQTQVESHALLALIKEGKTNWNKGFSVSGFKMIVPVVNSTPGIATAGVALGSETTAINSGTYTAGITTGLTQAEYQFAHYRNNIVIRDSELVLGANNARGLFLDARTKQIEIDFSRQLATDLSNITADSQGVKVLSIWWPAAATLGSSTMGGIQLESAPAGNDPGYWATNQTAAVGILTRPVVDTTFNRLRKFGNPDLMLCTVRTGGVDVYGRVLNIVDPAERIVNANFEAKYGFTNVMYRGMNVCPDYDIGSTVDRLGMFDTRYWFYGGYDAPKRQETVRLPGTDATELFFTQYCGIACSNPRTCWALNAITG